MSEKRTKGHWRWIKGERKTFFGVIIVTIIVSQIIMLIEESKKPGEPQIEASDLYLDYYLDENTEKISLYLINKTEIAIYRPKITILIPTITKEGAFTITGTGDCEAVKMDDNLLIVDFSQATIYPTFSNKRDYPVIDFKFSDITAKELKETEESLIYTIKCNDGQFSGKIPIFYLFTVK